MKTLNHYEVLNVIRFTWEELKESYRKLAINIHQIPINKELFNIITYSFKQLAKNIKIAQVI